MESYLKNNQSLLNFLDINKVTDFQLRRTKGEANSVIFRTDENLSDGDNRQRLLSFFEESKGSYWLVENKKQGAISIKVDNGDYTNAINTPPAQIGSISDRMEEIKAEAKRMFDDWMKDEKIKQLEKEKEELTALVVNPSPLEVAIGKIVEAVQPYAQPIIQGLAGKYFQQVPVGLSGIETQNENQHQFTKTEIVEDMNKQNQTQEITLTEADEKRLDDAFAKWAKVDPKFYEVIEYLADFADSGKTVMGMDYNALRTYLLNYKY